METRYVKLEIALRYFLKGRRYDKALEAMDVWNKAKARYCKKHKIDLHIDDSAKYGEHFSTPFALFKGER